MESALKQKLLDIVSDLEENKFTGQLFLIITLNDGGIRSCDKVVKNKVALGNQKRILNNPNQRKKIP